MAQKITAFVAKSFNQADEAKITPITKFLESFGKLGFILQDAEGSEVESVSAKVRDLIDKSDVLIGILTKKHPIYRLAGRWATAISALRGSLSPSTWSAPPWVLQESGYALRGNKSLILFRETDVEIPGLQGDLEYIPYDSENPAPAFQRASEMITGLIAKAGGIRVETIIEAETIEDKGNEPAAPPKPSDREPAQDETDTGEDNFTMRLFGLLKVVDTREWESAQRDYEDGLRWVKDHKPESEMVWKCFYQKALFDVGRAEALPELRKLAAENKADFVPLSYIAKCLLNLGEYDESVSYYLEAASISKPDHRASLEIRAAEVLQKAKKSSEAKEILLRLITAEYALEPETQFSVLQHLYMLSRESENKFATFSFGELALHKSPADSSFRFTLAYDYEDADQDHLSLYHYKILCDRDDKNATGFNNLGVASAKCGLLILAAKHYKQAYELGETLGASNLAFKYLEGGFSEDAVALLKSAVMKENCVPDVSRALASADQKIKEEDSEQDRVLARAEEHRKFLLAFAGGVLAAPLKCLDGRWKFPSVEIDLNCVGQDLRGTREIRTELEGGFGFATILGGTPPKPGIRTETFELSGAMIGRTCKFTLTSNKHDNPYTTLSALSGLGGANIEGYILFAEDCRSGRVAELKDGKPEKYYEISKLEGLRLPLPKDNL